MKKIFLIAVAAIGMMTANAQQAIVSNCGTGWSIGLEGGAASPLHGHGFFKNARGVFGLQIQKQVSPVLGVGVEGVAGVNTSSWDLMGPKSKTAIDNTYVGAYGAVNLMNLLGGYSCGPRVFEIEAVAGAGWGHLFKVEPTKDHNYFATKAGLNLNFNVSKHVTIALKPSVMWNMSDAKVAQTSAAYDVRKANFNLMLGLNYNFGNGFKCVTPMDEELVAALNAEINSLRAQLDACNADLAASVATNAALAAQLEACLNRPAQVVEKVTDNLESVRYVYFAQSSSTISSEQMRTVDIIASYMKNHADSKLDVKGYASPEGSLEFNEKLAAARAESVKTALVNKYKVAGNRITAKGEGIGKMFAEPTWNRVAICTLD